MKKVGKILIILSIIIFVLINYQSIVYADPNSSKGFAEYDDTSAQKENEKLIEEQNQEFDIGKSTNNYLKTLQVEGYELSPQFDKQTLEYTLNKDVNLQEINIIAISDDSEAKVSGTGNIKLEDNQDECRIEVTAESGTVRTYIIRFNKIDNDDVEEENIQIEEITNNEQSEVEEVNTIPEKDNTTTNIIIAVLIIVIIAVILVGLKSTKKKSKHGI